VKAFPSNHVTFRFASFISLLGCLFLAGCASLPAIKSSDSFQGLVVNVETAKPIGGILIVGTISTELSAWDNSGRGGGPHPLAEDYAISNADGRFSFPSFSGIAGPAVYSFGLTRTISEPYFELLGPGFRGSSPRPAEQLAVMPCNPRNFVDFQTYLEGEKRLSFRADDYPALLQLLEAWHQIADQAFVKDAKRDQLYERYKEQFESR